MPARIGTLWKEKKVKLLLLIFVFAMFGTLMSQFSTIAVSLTMLPAAGLLILGLRKNKGSAKLYYKAEELKRAIDEMTQGGDLVQSV